MEEAKRQVKGKERLLTQKVKNLHLDVVTEDLVFTKIVYEKLDEIVNLKDELVFAIEDFIEDYPSQIST